MVVRLSDEISPFWFWEGAIPSNVCDQIINSVDERNYNDRNDDKVSYDTQRSYYYMDALRPFYKLNHTILSPATEQLGGFSDAGSVDKKPVYGMGIRYDEAEMMVGTNMSMGNTYAQRVRSGLDGNSPNELFSYVYSVKRLMPTPNGAVVMN